MMLRYPAFALALLGLGACDPVTLSLVTAGGGVAFNHQMSSTITRTFSAQSATVHEAVLAALDRMSIVVKKHEQQGAIETIRAAAGTRDITLRVEPVTRTSTLLEVAVHQDVLTMDGATAREIVAQTEQALVLTESRSRTYALCSPPGCQGNRSDENSNLPGRTTYFGYDAPAPSAHGELRRVADKDHTLKPTIKVKLGPDAAAKPAANTLPGGIALSPAGA